MTNTTANRRRRTAKPNFHPQGLLPMASDALLVRPNGSDSSNYIPLRDIVIVRPSHSGLLDVVYTTERHMESGLTVIENKTGETNIDHLLIALGWQPGMGHNEHLALLTNLSGRKPRRERREA